ncbi:MAG: tetratricopeptide repeat protein [Hahellaceae bacterium]|nr:tetratricopeptide repeat protein [Hahellaceae bacterium]
MSLLNDVLRDLEQRQREVPQSNTASVCISALKAPPINSTSRPTFPGFFSKPVGVGVLTLLLLGWVSYRVISFDESARYEVQVPLPELPDRPLREVLYHPPVVPVAKTVENEVLTQPPPLSHAKTDGAKVEPESNVRHPERVSLVDPLASVDPTPKLEAASNPDAHFEKTVESFSARLAQAQLRVQQGRDSEAESLLRSLYDEKPMLPRVQELLAALRVNQRDYQGALDILARQDYPDWQRRLIRAKALVGVGEGDSARRLLSRHLPDVVDSPDYHATLAGLYQREKMYAEAGKTYQGLVEFNPSQGDWWVGLGISLDQRSQFDRASEVYREAVRAPFVTPSLKQYATRRLAALQPR